MNTFSTPFTPDTSFLNQDSLESFLEQEKDLPREDAREKETLDHNRIILVHDGVPAHDCILNNMEISASVRWAIGTPGTDHYLTCSLLMNS